MFIYVLFRILDNILQRDEFAIDVKFNYGLNVRQTFFIWPLETCKWHLLCVSFNQSILKLLLAGLHILF